MVQLPPSSLLNKNKGKVSFNIKPLILFVPILALGTINNALAWNLDIRDFWVKDYLDFAQNKGMFKPGATGLVLSSKKGTLLELPNLPFPDFSPVSRHGSTTSIGGAYMITAQHNKLYTGHWQQYAGSPEWGASKYEVKDSTAHGDFAITRLNKFVVETQGFTHGVQENLSMNQMLDRYGVEHNGKKHVFVYRAGAGTFELTHDGGKHKEADISYMPELLAGSIFELDWFGNDKPTAKQWSSFFNVTTSGDSGSGAFVWDNYEKRWVVLGVLHGIGDNNLGTKLRFIFQKWNQKTVDAFKAKYTHTVELNSNSMQLSATNKNDYLIGSQQSQFNANQDLSFKGGGTIEFNKDFDQGYGGLIFDTEKKYQINGNGHKYKGAGVDIGKGTTVEWNVSGMNGDALHKVGEGTLNVNIQQGNNLKTGNGLVVLNHGKTFESIYMANAAATVKLGKADALNTTDKANGIYIRGGTLDINGFSQTFKRIAASDDRAIVTNSSEIRADINFALPWEYSYHG